MDGRHELERIVRGMHKARRGMRYGVKRFLSKSIHVHIENRWRLGDEVLALPFYDLVCERYPDAAVTVSVTYPELIRGRDRLTVDNACTEFDCDRYIFAKDDRRSMPRLEHLCERHGIPFRPVEPVVHPPSSASLPIPLPDGHPRVACSCGAGWACKSLPVAFLRELCDRLAGMIPDIGFVEVGKGCSVADIGAGYVNRLGVAETAYVLANCDLYIGPDSGLAHLAMAVGTPAVVFYGPVNPRRAFGPHRKLHAILSPAECHGCWTNEQMGAPGVCPLGIESNRPGDYPCMRAFSTTDVALEIVQALVPRAREHWHVAACPEDGV